MGPPDVRHEPQRKRFVAVVAGGEAETVYSGPAAGVVTFVHTLVPRAARGAGVGDALARAGLEWARSEKLRVKPLCPFVAAYMRRHREFEDLMAGG